MGNNLGYHTLMGTTLHSQGFSVKGQEHGRTSSRH